METLIIGLIVALSGIAYLVTKFYKKGSRKDKFRDHYW